MSVCKHLRQMALLAALAFVVGLHADVARRKRRVQQPDTAVVHHPVTEVPVQRKMSASAHPVQLELYGRVVRVQSEYEQMLPVYTHTGTFYMAMRLSKGTNWLSGLPRGKYFINNRLITIN